MIWPFSRIWCELRVYHPTKLWASEWEYGREQRTRTFMSRCSDCGHVRFSWVERESLRAGAYREYP